MAPSRPPPPGQQQRPQRSAVPFRPGTAGPNRIQRPTAAPSGGAYALAGQESGRFLARPSEDAAHVSRSGTQPTRLNSTHSHDFCCSGTEAVNYSDPATNLPSIDTTLQESDELLVKWIAEGRKRCPACRLSHAPPCRGSKRKRRAREPPGDSSFGETQPTRRRDGFGRDYCFRCEDSHPWPDKDGTTYHTKIPPFWVKPPEVSSESLVAAASPLDTVQVQAQHVTPEPIEKSPGPAQAAPLPTQMAPPATAPHSRPRQDNRCFVDRMCDRPGGFTACMAEYRWRDRAIQSEEERMQFIYSWYVPPDKQPEEVRGTHGANEDYIWR